MTGQEWLADFAARLGVEPPDAATVDLLLRVAGVDAAAGLAEAEAVAPPG